MPAECSQSPGWPLPGVTKQGILHTEAAPGRSDPARAIRYRAMLPAPDLRREQHGVKKEERTAGITSCGVYVTLHRINRLAISSAIGWAVCPNSTPAW